jgi:hypothetical protein
LNQSFNLSNILIFTRYYTYYHQCKLQKALGKDKSFEELSDSEKYALHQQVFDKGQQIIDMRSLFSYLVEKVGTKEALDPVTKEDGLWKIIDFFTKKGISDLG